MLSMLGRLCGIMVICAVLAISSAQAQVLIRDADGGAPVSVVVMVENVKYNEARKRIAKSGLPKPKKGEVRRAFYYSGSEKRVKFDRLETATGKVLIEAIYADIRPLSTVAALVMRDDDSWGIVNIADGTFRPLPENQTWFYAPFGGAAPAVLLFGSRDADGTYRYCFTDAYGQCEKWVDRLTGGISYDLNRGSSAFVFQTRIVMNRLTPEGKKYSSSFDWNGDALLEKAPPVVPVDTANPKNLAQRVLQSVLYDLGPFDHPLGDYSTNLYWPMDENGAPIQATENFKGLFPLYTDMKKGATFEKAGSSSSVADLKGYVIVYEQDGTRTFEIAPNIKTAASAMYNNSYNYRWSDLYLKNRNYDNGESFTIAVKRDNGDQVEQWYPIERGKSSSMHKFLEEAWTTGEGYADPVVAIDTRNASDAAAAKAAQDAAYARIKERSDAIEALKARGGTMSVNGDLCFAAYRFTIGRSDEDSRLFFRAYDPYSTEVCRNLPSSIYSAMIQSGVVREEQAPPPPQSSGDFASAMKDWNDQLDQDRASRQGKSLRCYVDQGKRTCYYD